MPGAKRWIFRLLPGNGYIRSQLQHLLATDAEFAAFLEAAPQARRLLNPLCRMLGIDFDAPLGVPRVKPPAPPDSTSESVASPPPAPPVHTDGTAPSPTVPPQPPLVFSSP